MTRHPDHRRKEIACLWAFAAGMRSGRVARLGLDRIRAGESAETELHNVRAYLLEILEVVERDPGIEAASDDLYAVAKEVAGGTDRGARMSRLLQEALLRFGDRLATARPSEQTRKI